MLLLVLYLTQVLAGGPNRNLDGVLLLGRQSYIFSSQIPSSAFRVSCLRLALIASTLVHSVQDVSEQVFLVLFAQLLLV